jgi:hypothetical protein
MPDSPNDTLERIAHRIPVPEPAYERLLRRRDRKRRNQRIAAGVVGIAVFVAAIGIVTRVGPLNRSETSIVPGGGVTGPTDTGPDVTDVTGPTDAPAPDWDGRGLPPEGTELSSPMEGRLIGEFRGIHEGFVYVYADGRVIWHVGGINEQRLSPQGVELVRSGAVELNDFLSVPTTELLPADAWADPHIRSYAAPRYAVCYGDPGGYEDPSRLLRLLPAPAEAILRGKERTYRPESLAQDIGYPREVVECFEVTTEEARALDQTLEEAGFQAGGEAYFGFSRGRGACACDLSFEPVLPHGQWHFWGG